MYACMYVCAYVPTQMHTHTQMCTCIRPRIDIPAYTLDIVIYVHRSTHVRKTCSPLDFLICSAAKAVCVLAVCMLLALRVQGSKY